MHCAHILPLLLFLVCTAGLPLACTHPGEERGADLAEEGGEATRDTGVPELPETPPRGPFGYSLVAAEGGAQLDVGDFAPYEECGDCHERQWEELEGSMHVISHTDPLYRSTAELAREEAGEEIYTYCSG